MEERKVVSVRLTEDTISKLSLLAAESRLTRQQFIEKVLDNTVYSVELPSNHNEGYMTEEIIKKINKYLNSLKRNDKTTLKKIIGSEYWNSLLRTTKQALGKEFKVMVNSGEFPKLTIGNKKSNNEQQYTVI